MSWQAESSVAAECCPLLEMRLKHTSLMFKGDFSLFQLTTLPDSTDILKIREDTVIWHNMDKVRGWIQKSHKITWKK